jgi:IS5 family transposase
MYVGYRRFASTRINTLKRVRYLTINIYTIPTTILSRDRLVYFDVYFRFNRVVYGMVVRCIFYLALPTFT